jgi:hypothetical protein
MYDVQLLDPNGYDVPFARLPITTLDDKPAAIRTLLAEAPRHAAEAGVGYDHRDYTTRTQPAPIPTTPQELAPLLTVIAPAGQPSLADLLTAQLGDARKARLLLADAYMVRAAELRNAA